MEGGEFYLVYVIIGYVLRPAINKLADYVNEYVEIVLSYRRNLNFLKAKVEDLTTIISLLPSDDIEREGSSAESAVKKWVVKLRHLHGDASAKEQKIAIINVVSRYRASKELKQKISEMEKHLKLFPLIQLELILMCQGVGHPADIVFESASHIVPKFAIVFIKWPASILDRMKMVICFNREVASLKRLVTSVTPIVDKISGIPCLDAYPAIDHWCNLMRKLVEQAGEIESLPWWNVIRRYKDTKYVAYLIPAIKAHVKSASLMSLEPLFQGLPQKKHRPSDSVIRLEPASLFQEIIDLESSTQRKKLRPSAQVVETFIEVDASNEEGLRAKLLPVKDS